MDDEKVKPKEEIPTFGRCFSCINSKMDKGSNPCKECMSGEHNYYKPLAVYLEAAKQIFGVLNG